MIDTYRQQMIRERIDSGLSYEEALIFVNKYWKEHNPVQMFGIHNEINAILCSSWGEDFNYKYGPYTYPEDMF